MSTDLVKKPGEEAGSVMADLEERPVSEELRTHGASRPQESVRAERQTGSLHTTAVTVSESTKSYFNRLSAPEVHSIAHSTRTLASGHKVHFPRWLADFRMPQGLSKDDSSFGKAVALDSRGRSIYPCRLAKGEKTSPFNVATLGGECFTFSGEASGSLRRRGSDTLSMEVSPKSELSDSSDAEDSSHFPRAMEWFAPIPYHRSDPTFPSTSSSFREQGAPRRTGSHSMLETSPGWLDTISLVSSPAVSSCLEQHRSTSDGAVTAELLQAGDTSRLPSSLAGLAKPLRNTAHVLHWMTQSGGGLKFPTEASGIRSEHHSLDEVSMVGHVSTSDAFHAESHHTRSLSELEWSALSPSKGEQEVTNAEGVKKSVLTEEEPFPKDVLQGQAEREAKLKKKFLSLMQLQQCLNHLDGSEVQLPEETSLDEVSMLLQEALALWRQTQGQQEGRPSCSTLDLVLLGFFRSLLQTSYCHCAQADKQRLQLACSLMDAFARQAEDDHLEGLPAQSYYSLLDRDAKPKARDEDVSVETEESESFLEPLSEDLKSEATDSREIDTDEESVEPVQLFLQESEASTDSDCSESVDEDDGDCRRTDFTGNAERHLPTLMEELEPAEKREGDDQDWAARFLQILEGSQCAQDMAAFQEGFSFFVEEMVSHDRVSPVVADMLSDMVSEAQRVGKAEAKMDVPLSQVWMDFASAFLSLSRTLAECLGPSCVNPDDLSLILASIHARTQHGDCVGAAVQDKDDGQCSDSSKDLASSYLGSAGSEDSCSAGDTNELTWCTPDGRVSEDSHSPAQPDIISCQEKDGEESNSKAPTSSDEPATSSQTRGRSLSKDLPTGTNTGADPTACFDPDNSRMKTDGNNTHALHRSKKGDREDGDDPKWYKKDDSDEEDETTNETIDPTSTAQKSTPPSSPQLNNTQYFDCTSKVGSQAEREEDAESHDSKVVDDHNPSPTSSDSYLEHVFCAAAKINPLLAIQSLGSDLSMFPAAIHNGVKIVTAKVLLEVIKNGSRPTKIHNSSDSTNPRTRITMTSPRPSPVPKSERDVIEGQVKYMEVENAKLKSENKMIKDKLNLATCEVQELQERLHSTRESLDTLRSSVPLEVAAAYQKSRSEVDAEMDRLHNRVSELTRANSTLKAQAEEFEKMLEESKSEFDKMRMNSENSKVVAAYKKEAACLQEQVRNLKEMLKESEESLQQESISRRESEEQLLKIHNIKELLQAEVSKGDSMGTSAEKRVRSLEKRLQITEERLHQERADRASNLSQVEEKLLTENAKLKAQEKDLSRQLQRERDKVRNVNLKLRDLREESEKLRLALPLEDATLFDRSTYDLPHSLHSSQRLDAKKSSPEWRRVLGEVESALSLGEGEEKEMVMVLWAQRQHSAKRLQELETRLQALGISDSDDLAAGLKSLQLQREELETQREALEEKMKNLQSEKDATVATLENQLSMVVREKHEAVARLRSMEDVVEAVRGENEILRSSLGSDTTLDTALLHQHSEGSQEKLRNLTMELQSARAQIAQLQRSTDLLKEENKTLRAQLDARERALEEALSETNSVTSKEDLSARLREKLSACTAELKGLYSELSITTERNKVLGAEKMQLSMELEQSHAELTHLRAFQQEKRVAEEIEMKKVRRLEVAVEQKDAQLMKVSVTLQELSLELGRMKDINEFNQIHMDELENQLEDIRQQLTERSKLMQNTSNRDKEQMDQIFVLQQMVDQLAHETRQKDAELKNLNLELSRERDRMERLERRVGQVGLDISNHASDGTDSTSQTALDASGNAGGSPCTSYPMPSHSLNIKLEDLECERDKLKGEIQKVTKKMQSLESEFIQAQQSLTRVSQDLVEERSINKQFSTEKNCMECQLKSLTEERNALATQRCQAESDLERMEYRMQELMSRMGECAHRSADRINEVFHKSEEPEMMEIELNQVHAYMEEKDKEIEILKDKVRRLETERSYTERRLECLKKENVASKEDVNRITADLMTKMQENWAVFEMNQGLVRERHELQKQLEAVSLDMKCEREYSEKRIKQMENVLKQVETEKEKLVKQKEKVQLELGKVQVELKKYQLQAEREAQRADTEAKKLEVEVQRSASQLANVESTLKNVGNNATRLEEEVEELRARNEELKQQVSTLNGQIEDLQRDLAETQRNAATSRVAETEQRECQAKEAYKMIEELKNDRNALLKNLNEERKISAECQQAMARNEEQIAELSGRIEDLIRDYNMMDDRLQESRSLYAHCEEEKNVIAKEYELVADKLQKIFIEKQELEEKMEEIKNEDLKTKVKDLEDQVEMLTQANDQLKEDLVGMPQLQTRLEQLEINNRESLILLESIRGEMVTMSEANSNLQDQLAQANVMLDEEREQRRTDKDEHRGSIVGLNHTISQIQTASECEHRLMQDNLGKLEESRRHLEDALEKSQKSLNDSMVEVRSLTREMQELRCKLHTETSKCKDVTASLEAVRQENDSLRSRKGQMEEAVMELEAALSKTKEELQEERRIRIRLFQEKKQMETLREEEANMVQQKTEENIVLKNEVNELQKLVECTKNQFDIRTKKNFQQMKCQMDSINQEKVKISQQAHKLSIELEQQREQVAIKHRENLQMQEALLTLESRLREVDVQYKAALESLKMEEDLQHKMNHRFQEQEEEIRKLKHMLKHRFEEEAGKADKEHWAELHRMMSEVSAMLNRQGGDLGSDASRRLAEMECKLTTERRLHDITRASLQALEADCARLRKQMHQMHRKGSICDTNYNRSPKRMEEINDIISRCQSRVSMTTDLYTDGTLRHLSPTKDYNLTPALQFSPDNSIGSDCSLSSRRSFPVASVAARDSYHAGF